MVNHYCRFVIPVHYVVGDPAFLGFQKSAMCTMIEWMAFHIHGLPIFGSQLLLARQQPLHAKPVTKALDPAIGWQVLLGHPKAMTTFGIDV